MSEYDSRDGGFFMITRIHRDDIKARLPKMNVTPTDAEMKAIASKMADDYLNQLFWEQIDIIVPSVIKSMRRCEDDELWKGCPEYEKCEKLYEESEGEVDLCTGL